MAINVFTHEPTNADVLEKIRASLPDYLSGKRLSHTYSVESQALDLAKIIFPTLNIDEKYLSDISAAALLHDITKYYSKEQHGDICLKYAMSDNCSEAVIHARTGAFVARELFEVNDFVFGAIYSHTTGNKDMNIFEKIIFIADYIEPTRTHISCQNARNYFYENIKTDSDVLFVLNKTILMSIDSTLRFLIDIENEIDIETISARNSILTDLTTNSRGVKSQL